MKKFNLIKRLLSYSHEKQKPQRFARYAVMLMMLLTLGVGQMWAYDLTFRCIPKEIWGNNWTEGSSQVKINAQDENGTWRYIIMSDEGYTHNGYKIYAGKLTDFSSDKAHNIQFQRLSSSSEWQEQHEYGEYVSGSDICSKIRTKAGWDSYTKDNYVSGGYVYFDNSTNLLSNSYRYFVVGHNSYSKVYPLTQLANTNLWYADMSGENWPDATYCAFVSPTSSWTEGKWGPSNITGNAAPHTNTTAINYSNKIESGKYYLYTPASGSSGASISRNIYNAVTGLNRTQTVNIYTSTNRGSTYSSSATGGSVKVDRYYMNSSATEASHATGGSATVLSLASNTTDVVLTSDASFTGVAKTGYTFVGWSNNTTAPSPDNDSDWEIDGVSGTNIKYAFFRRNHFDLTYSPASPVSGTDHFAWNTKPSDADYGTSVTFSITPSSGWVMEDGYPTVNDGSAVSVTDNGDNSYTFTMRNAAPTITVSMVPANVDLHIGIYDATSHGSMQAGDGAKASLPSPYLTDSTVEYNSSITFTASPYLGYQVKDWYLNGVAQSVTSTTFTPANITAETTVQVSYEAIQYTITYHNVGDADNSANPTTYTIEDDLITLEDISYDGYHFQYWANHAGMTSQTNTIAAHSHGDKDFYAKWGRVTSWNWSGDPTPSTYASARTYTTKTEITTEPLLSYEYTSLQKYTRCYTLMNAAGDAEVSRQPEFTVNTSSATHFGEVTFIQPIAGTYRLKVELKQHDWEHNNCSDPTLAYAISDQFVVENVHKITLKYVSDGVEICPRYEVEASYSALAPTTTRADLTSMGYTFHHWEKGSNITVQEGTLGNSGSAGSNSITYTASDDDVLTEVYTTGGIYFKNTLGWDHVYLYRHNASGPYWDGDQGTGSNGGTFTEMTRVKVDETGDIYFVACSHTNGYVVSFVNQNQGGYHSYADYQSNTQVVYRTDFHNATPLFIPVSTNPKTDSYNKKGCYYIRGYWAKYNPEKTGYEVRVYDKKTSGSHIETVEFTWADDGKSLKAVANLEASKSLGFLMARADGSTGALYRNTGDYAYNTAGLDFTAGSGLCGLATKTAGDYTFKISCVDNYSDGTEGNKVQGKYYMQVDYPAKNGDYRLYYTQGKRGYSSFGNYRAAGWYHESDAIPQETLLNYVEVYVDPDSVPTLKLQQYTASTNTWADVDLDITFDPEYSEKGITSLAKLPGPGVYKFLVNTKTLDCASAECFCIKYRGKYEGNFYIRTNGVDKNKWDYKKSMLAHQMTYSEYSKTLTNHPFSHYYVKDLDAGTNVRFTVATEHTSAICDTLYHQDAEFNLGAETLPAFANVRFMYNEKKNHISRAFIGGSAVNTFLNVRSLHDGSKLYKEWTSDLVNTPPSHVSLSDDAATYDVDTITFKDNGNWIYEADVYAKPGATIKLTSKYHTLATQFFKGKSGAYNVKGNVDTLIGGTGSKAYPIKMIYDFKINRLTTAWVPSKLEADLPINADLMIVREHQKDAEQIDLGKDGSGNPYDLTKVKTVYGVMQFNKWTINNKSKTGGHADLTGDDYLSGAERALYWISFPFDVNLIDVFGFGEYGKHWILEYYDGKGRAKNGFWVDSESNWKFVEKADRDTFVLKANMGYVLALDLDHMGTSSDIWRYVEDVYLYFPSMAEVASIKSTTKTVRFPDQSDYECKIGRNMRNIKDSYWHCIGVPSFANASHNVFNDTEADKAGDWAPTDLMYLYEWNSLFNTLVPVDTKGKYGTPGSFNFKAMYAYLVQYSKDTMIWNSVVNHPDPSPIVKRAKKATEMENVNFKLELFKGDEKHDHAFICLTEDERVSTAFEFNYDLCKENNAGKGNIWTVTSDSIPVAGNVMPESEQTTILPVGIKTARAGEYTIAIPEGTNGVGVVLIDNITGTRTNLALTDYTVSLTKGATEGRFFLEISPISQVQTDIEQTNSEVVNGARKVIVDGNLYIVKDGKVFDARGNRVK